MSELRKDPISQRWVIFSGGEKKPEEYSYSMAEINSDSENCPFCEKNRHMIETEIASKSVNGRWTARIVNNKFPALIENINIEKYADGIYDKMTGFGYHEVIIDSHDHNIPFHELSQVEIEAVIELFLERFKTFRRDKTLKYVLFFKNFGAPAGASLSHSHSQLVATPVVPKIVMEELNSAKKYFNYKERCIFCDLINQEFIDEKRIITSNDSFIAIVPYAPRFPFESWILPKIHESSFGDISSYEISNLASVLKDVLNRLETVFPKLPYNFVIHTAPFENHCKDYYHWHIEIMPRLTKVAGFEWGSGFYITETSPEHAASYLK
jgi:UDPglucose--hexose-1-phosphate uridylyltransferase